MDATCLICNKTIATSTVRFCSAQCRQVAFVAMAEEAKSPDVLLVRFFFALMNEVMDGPITPELIDQTNRLRERWQRDLEDLRAQIRQSREPKQPKVEAPKARVLPSRARVPGLELQAALQILQVGPAATIDEVNHSFRSLAAQFHPDRNQNDAVAEDRFKRLNQAFHLVKTYLRTKAVLAR